MHAQHKDKVNTRSTGIRANAHHEARASHPGLGFQAKPCISIPRLGAVTLELDAYLPIKESSYGSRGLSHISSLVSG